MSDEPPKPLKNSDNLQRPHVSEDRQSDVEAFTLTSAISITANETTTSRIATLERPTTSDEITEGLTIIYTENEHDNPHSISRSNFIKNNDTKTRNYTTQDSTTQDASKNVPPPYTESLFDDSQEVEINITPPPYPPIVLYSAPPLEGAPPTYSAIMRIGPIDLQPRRSLRLFGRREVRIQPSAPFIAPIPPPSYAECHGLVTGRPILAHSILDIHDPTWGISPCSITCPICNNFVITIVHTRRSNVTHFSALALCICGCWPCCLLPYCMKSCKTSFHECPLCFSIVGIYNPW